MSQCIGLNHGCSNLRRAPSYRIVFVCFQSGRESQTGFWKRRKAGRRYSLLAGLGDIVLKGKSWNREKTLNTAVEEGLVNSLVLFQLLA